MACLNVVVRIRKLLKSPVDSFMPCSDLTMNFFVVSRNIIKLQALIVRIPLVSDNSFTK